MTLHESISWYNTFIHALRNHKKSSKFPSFTCKTVVPASTSTGFPSTNTSTIVPAARDWVRTETTIDTDVSMSTQVATTAAVSTYHVNTHVTSVQMRLKTHSLPVLDGARLPLAAPDKARPTAGKRNMMLEWRQYSIQQHKQIPKTRWAYQHVIMHDI